MFSRHRVHKRRSYSLDNYSQLRSMRALTHLTGVLSEHKKQCHVLYCTQLHFIDFGLRSLLVLI